MADRPTASQITDDELDALYAELADATDAVKEAREMTERGHAEVKYAQEVMGRVQARAERAEQQVAAVEQVAHELRYEDAKKILAALDDAQQHGTAGEGSDR